MTGLDGKTQLQMLAFKSPKIRLLRSMAIENETMQVYHYYLWKFKALVSLCERTCCFSLSFLTIQWFVIVSSVPPIWVLWCAGFWLCWFHGAWVWHTYILCELLHICQHQHSGAVSYFLDMLGVKPCLFLSERWRLDNCLGTWILCISWLTRQIIKTSITKT